MKIIKKTVLIILLNLIVLAALPKQTLAQQFICNLVNNKCVTDQESCPAHTYANCPTKSATDCMANNPYVCVPDNQPPVNSTCGHVNEKCCTSGGQCPYPPSGQTLNCVNAYCVITPTNIGIFTTGSSTCLTNNLVGIDTAIGCIPVEDTTAFVTFLLRWAVGIGGGIAFILLVVSGFMIMTGSGNPEKVQAGKELTTSAIMGLIMIIFSVFILKVIGVDILKLPGLP